jgi:hypothetical protein
MNKLNKSNNTFTHRANSPFHPNNISKFLAATAPKKAVKKS